MNERISNILRNPKTVPIVVGVVSFGAGAGIGYILGKKQSRSRTYLVQPKGYFEFSEEELTELRDQETQDLDEGEDISKEEIVELEVEIGKEFIQKKIKGENLVRPPLPEPEEPLPTNIFAADDDDWNQKEEEAKRTEAEPYVIHKDEFYNTETGFSQHTLTYYAGDEIMTDENDVPLYNHKNLVGPLLFGHGSGEPNIFYVRNHKNRAEYEVLLDHGMFQIEVMGLEADHETDTEELRHSYSKFKQV